MNMNMFLTKNCINSLMKNNFDSFFDNLTFDIALNVYFLWLHKSKYNPFFLDLLHSCCFSVTFRNSKTEYDQMVVFASLFYVRKFDDETSAEKEIEKLTPNSVKERTKSILKTISFRHENKTIRYAWVTFRGYYPDGKF